MNNEIGQQIHKEEIPIVGYNGRIDSFGEVPIHLDKVNWNFENNGKRFSIPIYSVWNYKHHQEIAKMITDGKACAMYVWGSYGTAMLLNSPEWQSDQENESEKLRTQLKKGRPWGEKFANFMHPDDMIDFWDIDRFHPNFKHLQWASNRTKLYEAGPVHIIAPTKKQNPHLDPSLVRKEDHTASYFYMPHSAWNRIVELLRKEVKHAIFGGGSLNFHQEEPGFTTQSLYKMISEKVEWQENIGLVVIDEFAELAKVFRSQTQIRIPQKESDGVCEVVRVGGLDPQTWSKNTGYPIKDTEEGVKQASSATPYNSITNLEVDQRISNSKDQMNKYHKLQLAG